MAGMQTTLVCLVFACLLQNYLSGGNALKSVIKREVTSTSEGSITYATDVESILRDFNITLPTDLISGVDCTIVNNCQGVSQQLQDKIKQLQQKTTRTIQLEKEVYSLQAKLRNISVKGGSCGLETSLQISNLQVQLEDKMTQLEQMSQNNEVLVLRITSLTNDLNELQNKINVTSTPTKITELQGELDQIKTQLKFKTGQLEKNSVSAKLVLTIIDLQTQIWELQKQPRSQETSAQISDLQKQLEAKWNELDSSSVENDNSKIVLMIIALETEIAEIQKTIGEQTDKTLNEITELKRQYKELTKNLTEKILGLPDDNTNIELTEEIMKLQNELISLNIQILGLEKTTGPELGERQTTLNTKKMQVEEWKKQLKGEDDTYAALISQIILTMKDLRAFQTRTAEQTEAATLQITELQKQVQDKKEEIAKLQDENQALQNQLNNNNEACSSLEIKYEKVKEDLQIKIDLLVNQKSSISKMVLKIVTLNDEVKWLRTQIISPEASNKIDELQKLLEQKNEELKSKSKELQQTAINGQSILKMIEIQNLIWEYQKGPATQSNTDQIAALQKQLDALIAEMKDNKNDDSKLVLKITSLQSEIVSVQRRLSDLSQNADKILELEKQLEYKQKLLAKLDEQTEMGGRRQEISDLQNEITEIEQRMAKLKESSPDTEITALKTQLTERERQLENNVQKLKEIDGKDYYLITQILNLQKKLRDIQYAATQELNKSSAEVTELEQQLNTEKEENTKCQAQNKGLEKKLNEHQAHCTELQNRYDSLKDKLEMTMNKLGNTTGYSNKLVLQVWVLTNEIAELKTRTASSEAANKELQDLLNNKIEELKIKTKELESKAPQPKTILRIIQIYNEMSNLEKGVGNEEMTFNKTAALQAELDTLIAKIQDTDNTNCKQILQIITLQNQVTRLQRQQLVFNQTSAAEIDELTIQLGKTKDQLNAKTEELNQAGSANVQLNSDIMRLRKLLSDLEMKLLELKQSSADKIEELEGLLEQKRTELDEQTTELRRVNSQNAQQILTIVELQTQMKDILTKETNAKNKADAEILELQKQVNAKKEEIGRCQVQNTELQKRLIEIEGSCSVTEKKYTALQIEANKLISQLQLATGSSDKLLLEMLTLNNEILDLKKKLATSGADFTNLEELLKQKTEELKMKTSELENKTPQPKTLLRIIAIQDTIYNLEQDGSNDSNPDKIAELEKEMQTLLGTIQAQNNGNCKQILQIIDLQNQVARLKRRELLFNQTSAAKIEELENQVEEIRGQLNEKKMELKQSGSKISQLTAEILELRNKLTDFELQLSELRRTSEARIEELQRLLEQKGKQLEDKSTELKAADAKNAEQILKILELQNEMKEIRTQTTESTETTAAEITELKNQLNAKKKENSKLDAKNRELERIQTETKMECDNIQATCLETRQQNEQLKVDLEQLQQKFKEKDSDLNEVLQNLKNIEDENARLKKRINILTAVPTPGPAVPTPGPAVDTVIRTAKVALDPYTANSKIILSPDGTQMTIAHKRQHVVDSPERYNLAVAVLGKMGFTSGRHYWEVDVAGQSCYNIGVASGSANRRGPLKLKPSSGYWTVMLVRTGAFQAFDARPSNLRLSVLPQKLGILLDYRNGEISFYNAGTKSLIYTFTGNRFTDTLYPFISACVDIQGNSIPIILTPVRSVSWIN